MSIFSKFFSFLWCGTLAWRGLQPAKILYAAQKRQVFLRLFFVDRQRQMKNVICEVLGVYPKKVLLKSSESFLPDALCQERCSLHMMFSHSAARRYLGVKGNAIRHGFLCKCRILRNVISPKTKDCIIEVTMPNKFIERDMQQHERVSLSPLMLKELDIWVAHGGLPRSPKDLPPPQFSCRVGQCSSLHLVNISAGGARVQIDNVHYTGTPKADVNKLVILRVVLFKTLRKELPVLVATNCVKVHYSRQAKILTLFLKFSRVWREREYEEGAWVTVLRDGVEEIEQWVYNDYCLLLDKKHQASPIVCERLGLVHAGSKAACR